jgi:pilus assembly protein CpaF
MLARLETMVLSGAELPIAVIRQQIGSAIDIIVHLSRLRDRSRRVTEICEITGVHNGEVALHTLYGFEEQAERDGKVIGGLKRTGNKLQRRWKLQMAGLSEIGEDDL